MARHMQQGHTRKHTRTHQTPPTSVRILSRKDCCLSSSLATCAWFMSSACRMPEFAAHDCTSMACRSTHMMVHEIELTGFWSKNLDPRFDSQKQVRVQEKQAPGQRCYPPPHPEQYAARLRTLSSSALNSITLCSCSMTTCKDSTPPDYALTAFQLVNWSTFQHTVTNWHASSMFSINNLMP